LKVENIGAGGIVWWGIQHIKSGPNTTWPDF